MLRDIAEQRAKAEADLAAIEQMRMAARFPRCPLCGQPVPPGSPACPSCGRAAMLPRTGTPPYGAPAPYAAVPPPYMPASMPPLQSPPPAPFPGSHPPAEPPLPAPAPVEGSAVCAGCGAALENGSAFCTNCGRPVSAEAGLGSSLPLKEEEVGGLPASGPAGKAAAPADGPAAQGEAAATEICSFCGEALDPDSALCTNCGKPAAEAVRGGSTAVPPPAAEGESAEASTGSPQSASVIGGTPLESSCPNCGTPTADTEALFCTECGARLR